MGLGQKQDWTSFSMLNILLVDDQLWRRVRQILTDEMFLADRARMKFNLIGLLGWVVSRCPKRRKDLIELGFITFITSLPALSSEISYKDSSTSLPTLHCT